MNGYTLRDGLWVSNLEIIADQERRIANLENAVADLKETMQTLMLYDSIDRLKENGFTLDKDAVDEAPSFGKVAGPNYNRWVGQNIPRVK